MSKYTLLGDYLVNKKDDEVVLTITDIENILKFKLADYARTHHFWVNENDLDGTTHSQCKAWHRAGFKARPSLHNDSVVFTRR